MIDDKLVEILVVDDNQDFASACVDIIELKCKIGAVCATTADKAKEYLEMFPIKVVILDQVMPTRGTDLFKQLKEIDKNIKAILISGESLDSDILEIVNMGFDYGITKNPSELSNRLPSMVLSLLMKYSYESLDIPEKPFYTETVRKVLGKFEIKYFLVHTEVIEKDYVFEDEWITKDIVHRGETVEFSEQINYKKDFDFSSSIHYENNSSISADMEGNILGSLEVGFMSGLSLQIKALFDMKYTESIENACKRSQVWTIPSDSKELVSRVYEYAKVYWKVKLFIRKICNCCNSANWLIETVYLPIPSVHYRIKEYSDIEGENCKIIKSGEIKAEYHPKIL